MTREEFILELRTADGAPEDEPFSRSAQRIADYDADRRVLIKDQRAEIERLKAELEQTTNNERLAWTREGILSCELSETKAQLATAKREVSRDFVNRAKVLAKEVFDYGMQTDTQELDLTTAEFGEVWQIAQKILQEIEQKEAL